MIRIIKRVKNSKIAAIMQYITLVIFAIAMLWVAAVFGEIGYTTLDSFIHNIDTLEEVVGTLALWITLACGGAGIVIIILSTIALVLNLHKPSMKRWKIARILNLICTIIIILLFSMYYGIPIINIIVVYIVIFNIYVIFFFRPANLILLEESEDL